MEKTTKKKKSKRARRRIGLIAVGGLSLVLTVCLSVGATLAWFAGSTWASNDLYMGGPVYVEMAGRNAVTGLTADTITDSGSWVGGDGRLDIIASSRTTGTVGGNNDNILLPGQKLLIYSQARVFSTMRYDDTGSGIFPNQSSGANTSNTTNGTATYTDSQGRIKTATSSVLRAKFSINVEFDPYVGFNNFTDTTYAAAYPVRSAVYTGHMPAGYTKTAWHEALYIADTNVNTFDTIETMHAYQQAGSTPNQATDTKLTTGADGAPTLVQWTEGVGHNNNWYLSTDTNHDYKLNTEDTTGPTEEVEYYVAYEKTYQGRRDSVNDAKYVGGTVNTSTGAVTLTTATNQEDVLAEVKAGNKVPIFQWRYVSENMYLATDAGLRMGAPFDGTVNSAGSASNRAWTDGTKTAYKDNPTGSGNGFYGIWVATRTGTGAEGSPYVYSHVESEAFYKDRCNKYLQSYVEHYTNENDLQLTLKIGQQLYDLENALNNSFKGLVTESSDRILAGYVNGFTGDASGSLSYSNGTATSAASSLYKGGDTDPYDFSETVATVVGTSNTKATWLYVDPKIGNDINASSDTTGTGGWWYLVESDTNSVASGKNAITTVVDSVENVTSIATQDDVDEGDAQYVGQVLYNWDAMTSASKNAVDGNGVVGTKTGAAFRRASGATTTPASQENGNITYMGNQDKNILHAKLFEVKPDLAKAVLGGGTTKVVSVSFPFVNGNFELPGKQLTNIFANAKITFKISFQALQAFFPFTPSIDGLPAGSALAGTAKALNIENAIPIYNEAFDYLSYLSNLNGM